MSENSENIEAKLCAYVEGDLDEAGRVEIERHLEAHPNHRRLLAELKSTRELLRFLPREKAPEDLSEAFNERLERSALLDSPGMEIGAATHTENLIPRFLAMAAVVVLTAGLAVVVYFALPRGESGTQIVMPMSTSRPGDSELTTLPSDSEIASAERTELLSKATGDGRRMSKSGDAFGFDSAEDPATRPTGAEPVYVVVFAENLPEAVREVTSNLVDNRIQWEPADEPSPAPLALRQSQIPLVRAVPMSTYAKVELKNALGKKRAVEQNAQQQFAREQSLAEEQNAVALFEESRDLVAAQPTTQSSDESRSEAVKEFAAATNDRADQATAATPSRSAGRASNAPLGEAKSKASGEEQTTQSASAPADTEIAKASAGSQIQATTQLEQLEPREGIDASDEQVAGIRALMTRSQVVALGEALNRQRQSVELIADDTELQTVNLNLQQRRAAPPQEPAAAPAVADAMPAPESVVPSAAKRESEESQPSATADQVASEDAAGAVQRRQRGPIAMKAGPAQKPADAETEIDEKLRIGDAAAKQDDAKGDRAVVLRRGATLTVTIDELAGPDTNKTTTVDVQRDGTVRLPKLDKPLSVDGLTQSQAETAIAEAYKAAAVIDSPTVTIEAIGPPPIMARHGKGFVPQPAASAPATVPAAGTKDSTQSVTQTRPSTSSPATQQAELESETATTLPAEEPLNVVILVRQQGALPATAPVAEPAETSDSPVDRDAGEVEPPAVSE
jgi:hypothetical protein